MATGVNSGGYRLAAKTNLGIVDDAITPTDSYHEVTSQSSTSDDLATINTSGFPQLTDSTDTYQPLLILQAADTHTITVKHGTGNISLNGGADFELSGEKQLLLFWNGTNWTDLGAGGSGSSLPVNDTTSLVQDPSTNSKQMRIDVGNVSDSTVRVLTMPDADVELFKNNLAASASPTTSNDNTEGYAVGSVWIDTTNDTAHVCVDASTGAAVWIQVGGTGGLYESFAIICDQKTAGTDGGSSSNTTWNNRDMNTKLVDDDNFVTISSNKFTFDESGEYELDILSPLASAGYMKIRLYNVTQATTEAVGTTNYLATGSVHQFLRTKITYNGSDELRVDTYTGTGAVTQGLGVASNASEVEIYTIVGVKKVA